MLQKKQSYGSLVSFCTRPGTLHGIQTFVEWIFQKDKVEMIMF